MGKHRRVREPADIAASIEQIYKEARVIIIVCLASWIVGRLRFSFAWLLFILAFSRTYTNLSMTRMKRVIRDECQRYHASKILAHGESIEWMNGILRRLWHMNQDHFCAQVIRYVNDGLARRTLTEPDTPPQKVILHSLALIELPLRMTRVRVHHKPCSPNLIFEGKFWINLAPHGTEHHDLLGVFEHPLIDLAIIRDVNDNNRTRYHSHHQHNLAVQVRQFTSQGSLRIEVDLEGEQPALLQPHIELQEQPKMDCTIKSISRLHFPVHFAHQVDWRRVVEMQLREGLGWAFRRPLPLGERWLIKMMTWWWHILN
ncbi:uncharacterized protein BP01DRAFT_8457 [Aspergillus saccharolyticus JOP 1030-1]|uniref:SMP-LTD domain-containing protein n=1 Tax=Aspergillus saccharolyticus JOP 1030-1 TaxID=1450539 RepID=A0A318ZS02_9EURO|nr:hypothetical protein BP01DRAFT_8457 [Aspergillus saccharolyticus JOP 1030-1]PYH49867.1 hypothetical protein BP01DRAFT_8457 [Aspergillus saccharolyticus JOP 1030-1]